MSTSTEGLPIPQWDLADRLNKALRVAGMTVQEMADYLGVHRNSVSAWINGRTPIGGPAIRAWAERTGVDYDWLATGDPTSPPQPPARPFRDPRAVRMMRHLQPVTDVAEDRSLELVEDRWSWYAKAIAGDASPGNGKPVGKSSDEGYPAVTPLPVTLSTAA